jgi:hypothetical protein
MRAAASEIGRVDAAVVTTSCGSVDGEVEIVSGVIGIESCGGNCRISGRVYAKSVHCYYGCGCYSYGCCCDLRVGSRCLATDFVGSLLVAGTLQTVIYPSLASGLNENGIAKTFVRAATILDLIGIGIETVYERMAASYVFSWSSPSAGCLFCWQVPAGHEQDGRIPCC